MKNMFRFAIALAVCAIVGVGTARADEPAKIKVGILLPLTGPFAAVAETQRDGALLAVETINAKGGLSMPWGKVQVEGVVDDDETKLDVGVRRYRYMVSNGVKGVGGQTWASLAYAINAVVAKDPMPYFPTCVMSKDAYVKGKLAPSTFSTAYSPWTVGYMAGKAAIANLGKKRIYFLGRADSWGWDMRDGVAQAAKELGGEVIGYDEVSLGTTEFTAVLQKVVAAKPDIFIASQFGGDAVALLNQARQMGLDKQMTIFNAFMTNVVAKGVSPAALDGVYALEYFYYDLDGFPDQEIARSVKAFSDQYRAKYQAPPDAYAVIAYTAFMEMFRGFEKAGSFDPAKVTQALMANGGAFDTVKGPANWREDHVANYKYAAFLVKGKGAEARRNEWDLFSVLGSLGAQNGETVLPSLKSLGY